MLRPIGTEFETEVPPDMHSTDHRFSIFTWCVIEHIETATFGPHSGCKRMAERIELVKVTDVPFRWLIKDGVLTAERIKEENQ